MTSPDSVWTAPDWLAAFATYAVEASFSFFAAVVARSMCNAAKRGDRLCMSRGAASPATAALTPRSTRASSSSES